MKSEILYVDNPTGQDPRIMAGRIAENDFRAPEVAFMEIIDTPILPEHSTAEAKNGLEKKLAALEPRIICNFGSSRGGKSAEYYRKIYETNDPDKLILVDLYADEAVPLTEVTSLVYGIAPEEMSKIRAAQEKMQSNPFIVGSVWWRERMSQPTNYYLEQEGCLNILGWFRKKRQ